MKYRINSLRLLVSTFGDSFDPMNRAPVHVLAQSFPGAGDMVAELAKCRQAWGDGNFNSAEVAMTQARLDIGTRLTNVMHDGTYTVESAPPFYLPIMDKDGNIIGHDTIGWLLRDGMPLMHYSFEPAQPGVGMPPSAVGMVACLYISLEKAHEQQSSHATP